MDTFAAELLPHLSALYATARRFGRDSADDLVQETYLRALNARASYRAGSNARAWLSRILFNAAYTEYRRSRRADLLGLKLQLAGAVGDKRQIHEGERLLGARCDLQGALERLRPEERHLIQLADVEGLGYREIAAQLGCPLGTVMSRLHRARRQLRRVVRHRDGLR